MAFSYFLYIFWPYFSIIHFFLISPLFLIGLVPNFYFISSLHLLIFFPLTNFNLSFFYIHYFFSCSIPNFNLSCLFLVIFFSFLNLLPPFFQRFHFLFFGIQIFSLILFLRFFFFLPKFFVEKGSQFL